MTILRPTYSGTGPMLASAACPVGRAYRLASVAVVFATAPATSENLTVELNSIDGDAYDVRLYTVDPSAASTTDVLWLPDEAFYLVGGDSIDVAYANTDRRAYTVSVTFEGV